MQIKRADKQGPIRQKIDTWLGRSQRRRKIIFLAFGLALVLLLILGSIYYGMFLHQKGFSNCLSQALRLKAKFVHNYFRGLRASPQRLVIDIRHKDFQKLVYQRELALEKRILLSSGDDYVPAKLRYQDKTIRAKLRLKGDHVDQLEGKKWPFRIVTKGENTLFGMKAFSIHTPVERNFFYEYLLHRAMKHEGVIALRYDFIDVTLNGKHLGVYALEEHFEKRLIEDNQRREGPIICLSEDAEIQALGHTYLGNTRGYWPAKRLDLYKTRVDLYRAGKTLSDEDLRRQFMLAKDLLEAFLAGKLKASEVFDCELLARYLALLDLFNAYHSSRFGNLKFYYNPVTSKLEPIAFDAEIKSGSGAVCRSIYAENWPENYRQLPALFLRDNDLFKLYLQQLWRVSEPAYLDNLFEAIDDDESRRRMDIIYSEYPYFDFSRDQFYLKQRYIRKILSLPVSVYAYFKSCSRKDGKRVIELEVDNLRPVPVEIISLRLPNGVELPAAETEKIISPSLSQSPVNVQKVRFLLPEKVEWNEGYGGSLRVNYALLGLEDIRAAEVIPWAHFDPRIVQEDLMLQAPNAKKFNCVWVDEKNKKIYIKPGKWHLDKNLIVGKGYTLVCRENTQLNLSGSAKILSYSPLDFSGSEENPILIFSKDQTGQGIIVINALQKSMLKDVVFDNLSYPAHGRWQVTGAVSFYQSPVEINNCRFSNSRSEDALNIVRSDFTIEKCLFNNNRYDAIDTDFSRGSIKDSSFTDCGNDAIDVSGTEADLSNIFVRTTGDKALSAGEKSNIRVRQFEISNAAIGIAGKDMSMVELSDVAISKSKIGLAVYRKKSEFGPAFIKAEKVVMDKVDTPYLVEEESELTIEGKRIEASRKNLAQMLY